MSHWEFQFNLFSQFMKLLSSADLQYNSHWCLQGTYVIYPSFLYESQKEFMILCYHVRIWTSQKRRHIETVFEDTIIL